MCIIFETYTKLISFELIYGSFREQVYDYTVPLRIFRKGSYFPKLFLISKLQHISMLF